MTTANDEYIYSVCGNQSLSLKTSNDSKHVILQVNRLDRGTLVRLDSESLRALGNRCLGMAELCEMFNREDKEN